MREILVPPLADAARNCIICPEDMGSSGLNVGGFVLSYPIVRSLTLTTSRPAIDLGQLGILSVPFGKMVKVWVINRDRRAHHSIVVANSGKDSVDRRRITTDEVAVARL